MATIRLLCVTFLFAILSIQQCICVKTPENSPSPSPEAGGDLGSLSPTAPAPAPKSPAPSPSPSPLANVNSPPAPSPTDRAPNSAPAPSPVDGGNHTPSPSPAPAPSDVVASDISHESTVKVNDESSSDSGMNGGKKAGVAFGVIAAACVVGLGALVYKKRRQNIRRAQYGYAARRDFL